MVHGYVYDQSLACSTNLVAPWAALEGHPGEEHLRHNDP
jgi:hypothetical protein